MTYALSFLYILIIVAANATATWLIPLPLGGVVSVADLFFGFTFTLRDALHRVYNRRSAVYLLIFLAMMCSAAVLVILQETLRIVLASAIGLLLAEAVDTELFHRMKRHWIIRVFSSNAISIPFDSFLFFTIAFAGIFPNDVILSLILTTTAIKYSVSIVGVLLVYPVFTVFAKERV